MAAYFKATLTGDIKAQAQAQMRARAKRLEILLEQEAGEIIQRTQSGKSIEGGTFTRYSDGYAAYKAKKGRRASPPDLTFTGNMLKSIRTKITISASVITGFIYLLPSQAIKAFANQITYRRPFFGLSNEQKQRIVKGLNTI